jgi:hypothetical protein
MILIWRGALANVNMKIQQRYYDNSELNAQPVIREKEPKEKHVQNFPFYKAIRNRYGIYPPKK